MTHSRPTLHGWLALFSLAWAASAGCEDDLGTDPPPEMVGLQLVAQGLVSPVALVEPADNSGRLFVVDQIGRIRIVEAGGQLLAEPFLDLSGRMVALQGSYDERGLLGLAFHPSYANNRRFYVYYSAPLRSTAPANWNHTSHVSEFLASNDPLRASAGSERVLLQVDQPQSNHNGGALAFGADGFLYISLGDGGGANDVDVGHVVGGNAQQPSNLLGSILRIDVNGAAPYGIPPTNPFVGRLDGRLETYAYGFRNPYRFSFDRTSDDLLVGDAGQNLWEEVSRVTRGGNYGWNRREGTHCFNAANPNQSPAACTSTGPFGEPLIDPVIEYPNANNPAGGMGIAVVGGYVYRGSALRGFKGRYVFGDFSTSLQNPAGRAWAATVAQSGLWSFRPLPFGDRTAGSVGHFLKGFGEDGDGEIYLLTSDRGGPSGTTGRVYRLVPHTP